MNEVGSSFRGLGAAIGVATSGVLPYFLVGALAVQLGADLGLRTPELGVAAAVYFAASAAASVAAGRLVQYRLGSTRGLRAAATLAAASMLAVALWIRSVPALYGMLAVAGVANAGAQPSANALVAEMIPPRRLALAFALKQSAVPLAALLGGLAVPLIAVRFGWRWVYAGGAVLAILALTAVPARRARVDDADGLDRQARPVSYLTLVLLAVGTCFGGAAAAALSTFLVVFSVAEGLSDSQAGLLLAGASLLVILTRVVTGVLADRSSRKALPAVGAMLAAGTAGYVLLASGGVSALLVGTIILFTVGWGWPGLFNYAVVRTHSHVPSLATGITQTGIYVGAILGPLAFGILVDRLGYGAAWLSSAAATLAAAGAMVVANRRLGRRGATASGRDGEDQGRWSETLRAGTPAQNS